MMVRGEGRSHQHRTKLADEESQCRHHRGTHHGQFHHTLHTVVLPRAQVISGNGLHALVQSDNHHHEDEDHAVDNAEGTDGKIASILLEAFIDENDDEASGQVHQEGGHADAERVHDDSPLQPIDAPLQVEQFVLVAHQMNLPRQGDNLGQHGGQRGTADAPPEGVDEKGCQHHVHQHREDGSHHGLAGMSGGAKDGVQPQIHVRHHITEQNDDHEVARA